MVTIKQKLTVKKITENHGNIGKSMREAGKEIQEVGKLD